MKEEIKKCTLADLCQVVGAKSYILPVSQAGRVKSTLHVPNRFEMGKPFAQFVTDQQENGFYLLSDHRSDLLYCSFVLNSGVGMIFLRDEEDVVGTKGTVTKKKLENVLIYQIPERYKRACNILELIITRVNDLNVEGEAVVARDATASFLKDMRGYITLEIYMKAVFEKRNVSVLDPWTRFVEEKGNSYRVNLIDDVFISFYKSVSDPDNDIMDAMKKAKLFVWELGESIKTSK